MRKVWIVAQWQRMRFACSVAMVLDLYELVASQQEKGMVGIDSRVRNPRLKSEPHRMTLIRYSCLGHMMLTNRV